MSRPVSPGGTVAERDAHTPRPTDEKLDYNFEPQRMQEESASSSPATDSADVQRKSFSSLSTRSGGSLSTSYSSADEHSEVGELPNDGVLSNEVRIQSERASSGNLETGHPGQKEGGVEKLEQQLAGLNVGLGDAAENAEEATEGDDAYLDDPLVQYTIQLHDYTVSRQ
jgi:hypothetical protein